MIIDLGFKDEKIEDILLKGNYITEEDIKEAKKYADEKNTSILDYFLVKDFINKDLLGQAIAEFFGVAYADINTNPPSQEDVLKIPREIATQYRLIFFAQDEEGIVITTDRPQNEEWFSVIQEIFPDKDIFVAYSLPEDIDSMMVHYRESLKTRFAKIIEESERVVPEIIDEIFEDALIYRASDIHFEPQEKEVVVRFRIDGILHTAGIIPKEYYLNILNRVKVQAHLKIDDHFSAQDSSIRFKKGGRNIDMRISIIPTLDGEKIVIRVLSAYMSGFSLNDLGLSKEDQVTIEKSINKPFGMILTTGPTGSGKTTTLYSILKILDKPQINITTIEDPVEYKIKTINQIQVNSQTGLTFSRGLRSIVRQDPDIILVGEIRDQETAEISVNAALTGHLLLSTFHSNDAATSIPRLLDMGIEPFLLSSTLELIIAQRLTRTICENCRYSYSEPVSNLEKTIPEPQRFFKSKTVTLYQGKGCKTCNDTGFKGRTAIFELILVDKEMQELILHDPSSNQIWEMARSRGAKTLFEDGITKVKNGLTTIDELLRVAAPPEDTLTKNEKRQKPKTRTSKPAAKTRKANVSSKGRRIAKSSKPRTKK